MQDIVYVHICTDAFSIRIIVLGNVLLMVFHVPVIGADFVIPADSGLMVGSDGCWSWYASGITMLLFSVFRTPHNVIERRIRVSPMPFCLSNSMKITTALYAQHIHSIFWKRQIYQHGILILKIINLVKTGQNMLYSGKSELKLDGKKQTVTCAISF